MPAQKQNSRIKENNISVSPEQYLINNCPKITNLSYTTKSRLVKDRTLKYHSELLEQISSCYCPVFVFSFNLIFLVTGYFVKSDSVRAGNLKVLEQLYTETEIP